MRFLYIFPHPDDESFGPVGAINRQLKDGHEVFLYTLTKGEATKVRLQLGVTKEEMGAIRFKEMQAVEETLGLTGMKVDDLPDSGLKEMDPRIIEQAVKAHIEAIKPDIIVSYPAHGISGFHDHLVMHAVIKRVYLEMKDEGHDCLKRLAFITLPDEGGETWQDGGIRFKRSEPELIDCIIPLDEADKQMLRDCLSCYETYKETIAKSGVIEKIGDKVYFEIFGEGFNPPISDLIERL